MKNRLVILLIIALIVFVSGFLFFLDKISDNGIGDLSRQIFRSQDQKKSQGEIKDNKENKEASGGSSVVLEKELPSDLPQSFFPSSEQIASKNLGQKVIHPNGRTSWLASFDVSSPLAEMEKYYDGLFLSEGWESQEISKEELDLLPQGSVILRGFKESEILVVDIVPKEESLTNIVIRYEK